jgi:hypothetical protein
MASNLQGFLSKFNSSQGKWVEQIDPLATFDCTFAFYPCISDAQAGEKGFFDKMVGGITSAVKTTTVNAANNLTGGLIGALLNDADIIKLRNEFLGGKKIGNQTFLDYVARGNLLADDESVESQLVLDLSYYIQNATVPGLQNEGGEDIKTMLGQYPVNGLFVKPSQNSFQLNIINTKVPLLERVFYPWMREVTLPYWSYDNQPYTTANVTISFEKHADFKYLFVGSRPTMF